MIEITRARKSKETEITLTLKKVSELAVTGEAGPRLQTGVPYFEHLLGALLYYGGLELSLLCKGDLEVDHHHSLEDIGLVLGTALQELYRSQQGFSRFASAYVPMDEALVRVALDISGRPVFVLEGIDPYPLSELEQSILEFLKAFTIQSRMTVHADVIRGTNRHHIFEALFKAYGKALGEALVETGYLRSTKGCIDG